MVPRIPHIFEFIHFRDRKDLPHLGLVILLIGGIILGVYLALQPQIFNKKAAEDSLVDVKFMERDVQVTPGKTYEVKIGVNPKGERVTGMELNLSYDPTALTILEVKNEEFLPITLKSKDSFDGNFNLIYAGTVQSQTREPGIAASIKFKYIGNSPSVFSIKPGSQVSISSKQGNVLTNFDSLQIQTIKSNQEEKPGGKVQYPDNLLLEKAFFPASQPFVDEVREAIEEKPEVGPERIKPELSERYILQLGKDIFVDPIVALNQVIEEKAADILKPE